MQSSESLSFGVQGHQFFGERLDLFECVLQMCADGCCEFIRLGHFVFGVVARIPQPSDVEVVIPCGACLAVKEAKPPLLPFVLSLCFPRWVVAECRSEERRAGEECR